MVRFLKELFLVFLLFTTALSAQNRPASNGEMLRVGEFHQDEVKAKSGETWLGLFRTSDGFELRPTVLTVTQVHDPIMDEDTTQKTGWSVTVSGQDEPIMLLRGFKSLRARTVNGSFSGMSNLLPGAPMELHVGGNSYTLSADGKTVRTGGGVLLNDYNVRLSRGGLSQSLVAYDQLAEDGMPSALWAGDLDGDGKLDLLLDLTNHYNVARYTLFLSSEAGQNELVAKVAEFVITGC